MAADFNLSAAISLQLAAGAVAKLKAEIQKGFTAPVEIDAKAVKKKISAVKKDAESDPIKVPITFVNKGQKDPYADIRKNINPFPIDVKFSEKSVRDNLKKSKLLKILGNKAIVIPIEVEYGTGAKAELEKIIKATEKLQKEQKRLNDLKSKQVVTTPVSAGSGKRSRPVIGDTADDMAELYEQIKRLDILNKQVFGGSKSFGGGYFQFARKQIEGLVDQLNKISGSDKGLSILEDKFKGLNGSSLNNAQKSLESVYKAYTTLDGQTKKLIATNKQYGGSFDISKQIAEIDEARSAIAKLLLSLDSSNPSTFLTDISAETLKVRDSTVAAQREMKAYSGLISNLNQKKAGVTAGDGRDQTVKNIDALIAKAKELKGLGLSTDNIRADAAFQKLAATAGLLQFIDRLAQRAGSSIDAAVSKVNKGELKDTFGGRAVGLKQKIPAIGARTNAALALTTDPKAIDKIKTEGLQDAAQLNQQAGDVQKQFNRLYSEIVKLQAANLDAPAKSLSKFIGEIYRLVQAGASLSTVDNAVSKKLAEVANVVGLEKKVNTAINQIGRLKHALEFSPVTDNAGARKALDQLETDLKARVGKFKDLTPEKLTQGISSGLFDVRALQRFNDAADTTSQKLRNIGDSSENLAVGKIYTRNADEFDKAAEKIASGAGDIGQKLRDLKNLSDKTLIQSKFDAEGGFFGSIAKSAGLATKRLAAFLFMAQGLYTVQSLLSASLQEAIKIDREFIKLEQVFNKDFSGAALEKSLANVKKQIFDLGKSLGVSASEIADAAQILAQAGVAGKDLEILLGTVAKSQLGPSFAKATDTAEAAIAIFQQFNLTAKETQDALGGINRLSAKYAVEAKGITEAVRRAGGIFSSSGDDIGQFAAAFTLVKQQTREADEAIATGLRNVAQRLQSSTVQTKLREALGINLVENGEFVGFEESITRIGKALKDLPNGLGGEKSPLFAQIREIIGGARQGGRITPLLQDFAQFAELNDQFRKGAKSIDEDVSVAFNSIENKIQRAKTAVTDLFHEIISSDLAKILVEAFVQITTFATNLLKTLNSIPGAILAIGAAAQILGKGRFVAQAIAANFAPRSTFFHKRNKGGIIPGFNKGGGYVGGNGPNKDSVLAALTPKEFVLQRSVTQEHGVAALNDLNQGRATIIGRNKGGIIGRNGGGVIPGFNKGGGIGRKFKELSEAPSQEAGEAIAKALLSAFKVVVAKVKKGISGLIIAGATPDNLIPRTSNLPDIVTQKSPPKLTKAQRAAERVSARNFDEFEKSNIRFPDSKAATPIPTTRGTGIDRVSLEESKKRQAADTKRRQLDNLDKKATEVGSGRYQFNGQNPALPPKKPPTGGGLGYPSGKPTKDAGNRGLLQSLLGKSGISVNKDNLENLVNKFTVGQNSNGNTKSKGQADLRAKSINIVNPKDIDTLAHEFGHILAGELDDSKFAGVIENLPDNIKNTTRARVEKVAASGSNTYGKIGSQKLDKKLNHELIADAYKNLAKTGGDTGGNAGLESLKRFAEQKGVEFTGRTKEIRTTTAPYNGPALDTGGDIGASNLYGKDPATGLNPTSIIDQIRNQKRATPDGFRGQGSDVKPYFDRKTPRISFKERAERIAAATAKKHARLGLANEPAIPNPTYYPGNTPPSVTAKSPTQNTGGANVPPNLPPAPPSGGSSTPPPGGNPNIAKIRAQGAAKRPVPNVSGLAGGSVAAATKGASLPKGALASFGKDLISTKGGIISLVTAFALLQGVLGQFGEGVTDLVTAVAAAAFSMYTFASLGPTIVGVQKKIGGLGKGIIAGKGKDLAEKFAESGAGKDKLARAMVVRAKALPGTRVAGTGPKLNAVGKALSTKDILAAAGPKVPLSATQKAALAASNSAARSTAAKAAQASAQSGIGGVLTKVGSVSKSALSLTKGLNGVAIAFGLVTGALGYFAASAEKSADLAIENATTLKEVQQAGSKKRLANVSGKAISKIGRVGGAALAGASIGGTIGSAVPIIGTAVGAITGGLVGGMLALSSDIGKVFKNTMPPIIVQFADNLKIGFSIISERIQKDLSDAAFIFSENLKGGSKADIVSSGGNLAGKLSGLAPVSGIGIALKGLSLTSKIGKKISGSTVGDSYGDKKLALAKDQEERVFRLGRVKNRLSDKSIKGPQADLGKRDLEDLAVQGLKSRDLVADAKKSKFNEKTGVIEKGTFKDLAPEAQEAIKNDLQGVADIFNSSGPKNQALISKMYDDAGVNIVELANEVGVSLDKTKNEAAAAFDKLSLFFSEMGKNVEFAGARASGLEGGLAMFSNTSASSRALAPDQLLDILGSGIDPKTLGLGNTFDQSLNNTAALTEAFDPRLKAAADFDIKGRRASRDAATGVIKAAPDLKSTDAPAITSFLQNSFNAASGGDAQLGDQFGNFLKTKVDDIGAAINADGSINATVVSDLFKEFGDKFSSGALEEVKRINDLAKQYSEQYKQQLAERFALEGEIIGLLQSNVGKRKGINDTINKAAGLTGDKLAAAEGRQAAGSTFENKQALLTGTGFGGNASVGQLQAGLLASQQRQRDAGKIAAQGGGGIAAITTRTAEIEAVEAERQKRLKDALTYVANGTDSATHAMAEFERASQKAATSSKNLSDALLGSDDQMMQTILGIQAMDKVQAAFAQGGIAAAQATLGTLGEDARQALGARVGSDPELQAQFNQSVGIGNNISASPEAGAAIGVQKEQIAANNALIAGITDLGVNLAKNTGDMQKFYEAQFNNTQQIIQQAENTTKNLVAQIAGLPEVIKHEVGDFNINIVGADIFNALDPAITKIVAAQVQAALDDFGNGLVANNAGLNRPK